MKAACCAILAMLLLGSGAARAHPMEPSRLSLHGDEATLDHARDVARPRLVLPPHCRIAPLAPARPLGERVEIRERWDCAGGLFIVLSAAAGDPPLVVEVAGRFAVLDAGEPVLAVDLVPDGVLATLSRWLALGVGHLAGGLDHVLLILGLIALIGLRRRLVAALTAFTLGHSLSLALGATGLVSLPSALVESAIALTLVLLALDLAAPGPRPSLLARGPWLAGTAIGLVHGLGFASVLADTGLPSDHGAIALLGFNLGLELAQLAVVLCAALGVFAFRVVARRPTPARALASLCGWSIGIAGSAWLVERALFT